MKLTCRYGSGLYSERQVVYSKAGLVGMEVNQSKKIENYNVKIRERMGKVLDGCHHTATGNYPKRLNSFLRWISTEDVLMYGVESAESVR